MKLHLLLTLICALAPTLSMADNQPNTPPSGGPAGKPPGEGHRPPPPEAFAACKSLKAEDNCNFTGRSGREVQGKCFSPDSSKPLACRPHQGTQILDKSNGP